MASLAETCSRCGKTGHRATECSKPFLRILCSWCNKFGHAQPDCFAKRRAEQEAARRSRVVDAKNRAVVQQVDAALRAVAAERWADRKQEAEERAQRRASWELRKAQAMLAKEAEVRIQQRREASAAMWEANKETRKFLTAAMALKRIAADLDRLQSCPLPGIAAAALDENLQVWHFNLRGARGELSGLLIHGVMRFPPRYPIEPPELRLCTPAPHPNVEPSSEGYQVCMDLLEPGGTRAYGGWSSSYCAGSLLLQLQSVLFDERALVTDALTLPQALAAANDFTCPCGHKAACPHPAFSTGAEFQVRRTKVVQRQQMPLLQVVQQQKPLLALPAAIAEEPEESSTAASETSVAPAQARQLPPHWGIPKRKPQKKLPQTEKQLGIGDMVVAHFKVKAGGQSKRTDVGKVVSISHVSITVKFQDGARQSVPEDWIMSVVLPAQRYRCLREATPSDEDLAKECEASAAAVPALVAEGQGLAPIGAAATGFHRLPKRLLIEVLTLLAPADAVKLCLCAQSLAFLGEEGILWKEFFRTRYPRSELTAQTLADWKHCFLLEAHHVEADLVCFHTKVSFQETLLGVPIDFSFNPRTAQVDYIYTTLDLLSVDAFDSGVRLTQWNESFTEWLPLFLTAEHFARARPRFEECIFKLCPHWSSDDFRPGMVLDIIPRLMNTMIVLLCDKGIEASERAINGYFLMWRLLVASVKVYDLDAEVQKRLEAFKDPENRHKKKVPSMGDFLPLLAACPNKGLYWWQALAAPILQECSDRSVLWACRDCPEFAEPEYNVIGEGVHEGRLLSTFQSTKVSKRLLMFHVHFLELVDKPKLDLFFGQTPNYISHAFQKAVRSILEVDDWTGFYEKCQQPLPDAAQLTDMLRQATHNSLRKGYHSKNTNFSRIQAHGVSHILQKGETYCVRASVHSMRLELGSDSSNILCGACLIYEDLICANVVHYGMRAAYNNAVRHSGDQQVNGVSKHVIEVDLDFLPASVTRLFFTLCACGCTELSGFKNPTINFHDQDAQPMCTYTIEQAGRAPTVVMAAIWRMPGAGWQVTAIGFHSEVRCCGNYSRVKRDITKISL